MNPLEPLYTALVAACEADVRRRIEAACLNLSRITDVPYHTPEIWTYGRLICKVLKAEGGAVPQLCHTAPDCYPHALPALGGYTPAQIITIIAKTL